MSKVGITNGSFFGNLITNCSDAVLIFSMTYPV